MHTIHSEMRRIKMKILFLEIRQLTIIKLNAFHCRVNHFPVVQHYRLAHHHEHHLFKEKYWKVDLQTYRLRLPLRLHQQLVLS
jgi:hypothetical protein